VKLFSTFFLFQLFVSEFNFSDMYTPSTRIIDLTVGELEKLITSAMKNNNTSGNSQLQKQFYSPKEFAFITGYKYSTVVYRCTSGKLKARQETPKSSWQICATEVERYKEESNQNL
jgi:hypothetical protein